MDKRLSSDNPQLFLDIIKMRKDRQQDNVILMTGARRSGKSFAAIQLARRLSQVLNVPFDFDSDFHFDIRGFLRRWQTMDGGIIIGDEWAEAADRRRWQSVENFVWNSMLQREGFKRNIAILTFPSQHDLDTRSVRNSNYKIEMGGIDYKSKVSWGRFYRICLADWHANGFYMREGQQDIPFSMPDDETLEKYKKLKTDWNFATSEAHNKTLDDYYAGAKPFKIKLNELNGNISMIPRVQD